MRKLAQTLAACIGASCVNAHAQEATQSQTPALAEQFVELCVAEAGIARELPGSDVAVPDAPFPLRQYAEAAMSSRVVRIGSRYAMRAHNPARADPVHAVIIRCAVTGAGSFSDEVSKLSELLGTKPNLSKTAIGYDAASFRAGAKAYHVFAEADGWVSIFSLDLMMRNIDPKYLKPGVKPAHLPPVR